MQECRSIATDTMITGMKAQTIGRVLGIGVRVAGRMAGQRLSGTGQSAPAGAGSGVRQPATVNAARGSAGGPVSGPAVGRAAGSVARGVGGFLKPFRRVGNIVFLEVAGVFFFLFVLVFGNWAWRLRDQASSGPDHSKFLVYVAMMLLFLYLSGSSFWRARRK
jgi:hypothetical protein